MSNEVMRKIFLTYFRQLHEWEGRPVSDLHAKLYELLDSQTVLTTEQRGFIGIACAVLEEHGLNKKIGDLGLP